MITKKDIMDAYVFLRTKNHSIPDEVLDFIKDAAIEKLNPVNDNQIDYDAAFKDGAAFAIQNFTSKSLTR